MDDSAKGSHDITIMVDKLGGGQAGGQTRGLGEALAITGGGEVFPLFGRWLLSRLYCGIKTPLSLKERATLTLTGPVTGAPRVRHFIKSVQN